MLDRLPPLLAVTKLFSSSSCKLVLKPPKMFCSIPTSRSTTSWLDRLHACKGFTVPADLDLDHFLHSNSNPKPTPLNRELVVDHPLGEKKLQFRKGTFFEKEQRLFSLMSNVLSEIFVMGDPRNSAACLKGVRKQLNPRACVPSASASVDGGALALSLSSADNSIAEAKRDRKKMKRMRGGPGQAASWDPSVCTGTVVTVIDTSSPGWKTEKHFRKGMVSKRREKVWNVSRKKRKFGSAEKFIVEKERAERLRPLAELKEREQNENAEPHNEWHLPSMHRKSGLKVWLSSKMQAKENGMELTFFTT